MLTFGCLIFAYACDSDSEPDYEYRKIKIESLFSEWKQNQDDARAQADSELGGYAKGACRKNIRSGWSLADIEDLGQYECETTAQGHHCRRKDVVLICRRVSEFFP